MTAESHLTNFLRNLKLITLNLARKNPNDPQIDRAKKRVLTSIDKDPHGTIMTAGKKLYEYKDKIYAKDKSSEDYFLNHNFANEVDNDELVSYVIIKTQECAKTLPENEKEDYKNRVVGMLDDYLEYVCLIYKK